MRAKRTPPFERQGTFFDLRVFLAPLACLCRGMRCCVRRVLSGSASVRCGCIPQDVFHARSLCVASGHMIKAFFALTLFLDSLRLSVRETDTPLTASCYMSVSWWHMALFCCKHFIDRHRWVVVGSSCCVASACVVFCLVVLYPFLVPVSWCCRVTCGTYPLFRPCWKSVT